MCEFNQLIGRTPNLVSHKHFYNKQRLLFYVKRKQLKYVVINNYMKNRKQKNPVRKATTALSGKRP
jgi:hypothetical protein